ncbi:DUF2933 domain-containing protein [Streptomyces sp. NPDC002573]|uniref:DUF2933 domain-containing protein n=1 Tax=Streptomyces sp. NPDC002573 TaxID=3364651 RepID=UPI003686E1B3
MGPCPPLKEAGRKQAQLRHVRARHRDRHLGALILGASLQNVSDWVSEPERCSALGANRFRALVLNDRSRQPAWHVPPDAGRPGRKTRPRRVPDVAWAPGVHVALCHRVHYASLIQLVSLIWLALMAVCPLMMFFMMRNMRGQDMHGGHDQYRNARDEDSLHKHDHPTGPSRP